MPNLNCTITRLYCSLTAAAQLRSLRMGYNKQTKLLSCTLKSRRAARASFNRFEMPVWHSSDYHWLSDSRLAGSIWMGLRRKVRSIFLCQSRDAFESRMLQAQININRAKYSLIKAARRAQIDAKRYFVKFSWLHPNSAIWIGEMSCLG